jgi:hypothetical protein
MNRGLGRDSLFNLKEEQMKTRNYWLIAGLLVAVVIAGSLAVFIHASAQAAPLGGSVSGVVWQDFCGGNCVAGSSLKRGNAVVNDAEKLLGGIRVKLAPGRCVDGRPATRKTTTNMHGFYLFSHLTPGKYCVSVNNRQSSSGFPKPGYWTRPSAAGSKPTAFYDITIVGTSNLVNKSFGWNYK